MGVTVRRVRADEGLRLREIRLAALADAPTAFTTTLEEMVDKPVAFWTDRVTTNSEGNAAATFLAESDGEWVGMVAGWRETADQPWVELVSMWVAPVARGTGAGRALVEQVVDWSAEIGIERVELWVTRGNDPAIALYERCGFDHVDDFEADAADPCAAEQRMRRG